MACFLGNLLPLRPVPYRFSMHVLLPMIISSLLSCSYLKSCQCYCPTRCYYSTDQQIYCSYSSFEEMRLYLHSTDLLNYTSAAPVTDCGADLFGYVKKSYPGFNFSSTGMLIPHFPIQTPLWINSHSLFEASFDLSFTMGIDGSAGESNVGMLFAILSSALYTSDPSNRTNVITIPNGSIAGTAIAGGSKVSVQVSPVPSNITIVRQLPGLPSYDNSIGINISIIPPQISTGTNNNSYNVSVKYDSGEHQLSVSVVDAVYGAGGNQRDSPILSISNFDLSSITNPNPTLGFFSTVEQLQRLKTLDTSFQYFPEHTCPAYSPAKDGVTIALPVVIGSSVVVAGIVVAAHCYINSKYRKWKKDLDRLAKIIKGLPGVPKQVEYADIKRATNDFHESMEIGRGGFGAVYRCRLPASITGEVLDEVAVKKFMRNDNDHGYENFVAEVSIINRLRHKNIVPLIGWSYHKGQALLIYKYMSNGSLDQHLFRNGRTTMQQQNMAILQWKTRYDIVRDIATGLHYIHHEHEPMVLHRDIKASNVMLDSNLHARLGDFGIACTVDLNKNSVSFSGMILGTWGYIAPEYAKSCKATRESDIYAFGVLALEIVTGRRQLVDVKRDDGDDDITDWVLSLHREGKLLQTVDGSLLTAGDDNDLAAILDEAERVLLMGLACTHPNPSSRPSMVDVVHVITKLAPLPDVSPDRPISPKLPTQDWRSRNSFYSTAASHLDGTGSSTTAIELVQLSQEQPSSAATKRHVSFDDSAVASGSRGRSHQKTCLVPCVWRWQ